MQDEYSCPVLPPNSDQIDLKLEAIIDAEDENTHSPSAVVEMKLRNLMTQGEMEILTTWFPKASKTLTWVLPKRGEIDTQGIFCYDTQKEILRSS
jgi:hypothetical protein